MGPILLRLHEAWARGLHSIGLPAHNLQERASSPAPISVAASSTFEGDDGDWSTFAINLGSNGQLVNLLPSTASTQTWTVFTGGCPSTIPDCQSSRGGVFDANTSLTWKSQGTYTLSIEQNLGVNQSGIFGNDSIALGASGGSTVTLNNQVVVEINSLDYWLGILGLNPAPTSYNVFQTQPSLMTSLKTQNLIPSTSFGYTAGNPYRLKSVLGSLTLGGYDANRFQPNNVMFNFAPNNNRNLVVGIESISTTVNGTTSSLLPSSVLTFVDSTETEIWLPLEACKEFEKAFNISWDTTNDIYTIGDEQHAALTAANPNITFQMSNLAGGPSLDLVLPYAAFDLEASWPRFGPYPNTTRYFPVHRAANESQYTLGRTFLQEVYLIVNWDNSTFSLSQCVWPEDGLQANIVAIGGTGDSTSPQGNPSNPAAPGSSPSSSGSSSTNSAAIGAGVGVPVGIILLALIGWLFWRRRRRQARQREHDILTLPHVPEKDDQSNKPSHPFSWASRASRSQPAAPTDPPAPKRELGADLDHAIYEAGSGHPLSPAEAGFVGGGGRPKHIDLPGSPNPSELRGQDSHAQELESPPLEDSRGVPAELAAGYGGHELLGSPPMSAMSSPRSDGVSPVHSATMSPNWGAAAGPSFGSAGEGGSRRQFGGTPSPLMAAAAGGASPTGGLPFSPVQSVEGDDRVGAMGAGQQGGVGAGYSNGNGSGNVHGRTASGGSGGGPPTRPPLGRNPSSISDIASLPSPRARPAK